MYLSSVYSVETFRDSTFVYNKLFIDSTKVSVQTQEKKSNQLGNDKRTFHICKNNTVTFAKTTQHKKNTQKHKMRLHQRPQYLSCFVEVPFLPKPTTGISSTGFFMVKYFTLMVSKK